MMERSSDALPVFNMKAVVEATGISAETLRSWERRFGILRPARTDSGYRKYSRDDVQTIRWLQARLAEGFTIGRAVELLQAEDRRDDAREVRTPDACRDLLVAACLSLDERSAEHAIASALAFYPVEVVCLQVLAPALAAIGECAATRPLELGPAYFAAELIRSRLMALYGWAASPTSGPTVLLATAPDEAHDLGLLMVALSMRRAGLRTVYLGPVREGGVLVEMAGHSRPDIVCLSASSPTTLDAGLAVARRLVDGVAGHRPTVLVGGHAVSEHPERVAASGAIAGDGDLSRAVERVLTLGRGNVEARAS